MRLLEVLVVLATFKLASLLSHNVLLLLLLLRALLLLPLIVVIFVALLSRTHKRREPDTTG
ncbi:MAG TPA: hypothetical protein VM717_11675 [Chthoniobacterales bacterium]|nr:hypothetical protein [Chthoniobacterales bacterium]